MVTPKSRAKLFSKAPAIKEKLRAYAMRHADLTFKYDFWWRILRKILGQNDP
jgi:hypothetical protein